MSKKEDIKYGFLIGRFQPFHLGHRLIVEEIMADGLEPILLIGSINKLDDRNPLDQFQRQDIIRAVYPNIEMIPIPDIEDWNDWYNTVIEFIGGNRVKEGVFYAVKKAEDRYSFNFKGKDYIEAHYHDIFNDMGHKTKLATYPSKTGLLLSATDIRKDFEKNRHYLDASVYKHLKQLGFKKKIKIIDE